MSRDGFGAGGEQVLDQSALASVPEDLALLARIADAIATRAGEGATDEQRLAAAHALIEEDEDFCDLVERLQTLKEAGEAKEMERFVDRFGKDEEAEK